MFGEILKSASQFRDEKVFFSVELIPQFLHHLLGLNETVGILVFFSRFYYNLHRTRNNDLICKFQDDVVVAYGLLNMLKYTPGPCSQHSVLSCFSCAVIYLT